MHIQNASRSQNIPDFVDIQTWIAAALVSRCDKIELTVRIVDEPEITALNETYRHKQDSTNVLSFPLLAAADTDRQLLGDIVICAPIVEQEAAEQQKLLVAHWAHMVIHGCLHLLGYDHIEEQQAEEMEQLEKDSPETGRDAPFALIKAGALFEIHQVTAAKAVLKNLKINAAATENLQQDDALLYALGRQCYQRII